MSIINLLVTSLSIIIHILKEKKRRKKGNERNEREMKVSHLMQRIARNVNEDVQ